MKEASNTDYYSVANALYQVIRDENETKAYIVDSDGKMRQVGLALVYAEGTPMEPEEFNAIVAQRTAKRPIRKPSLSIVPKNG